MVDLGGSLAVASMGLFGTGVSTDLNGMGSVKPAMSGIDVDELRWQQSPISVAAERSERPSQLRPLVTNVGVTNSCRCTLTDILIPLAVGRNLAYTTVIFKNAQGEITARGSHTK